MSRVKNYLPSEKKAPEFIRGDEFDAMIS